MPVPATLNVVLSIWPAHPRHILIEHGGHDLQPRADSQGQQTLPRRPAISAIATTTCSGTVISPGSGSGSALRLFFW
jgi:hypothetical protein